MLYKDIYKQEKQPAPFITLIIQSSLQHSWPEMEREARRHGMVRTCRRVIPSPWNPKPEPPSDQRLDSIPVARLFSNVPSKPSNHFKFTGKCGRPQCLECHLNPVRKSKDKTKGTQKLRTSNRRPGLKFSGFSVMEILEHLYSAHEEDEIDDHVSDDDDDNGGTCALDDDDDDHFMANFWSLHEKEIEEYIDDDDKFDSEYDYDYDDDDDDDDAMSFCDVGLMFDQTEGDEGWCLLREM